MQEMFLFTGTMLNDAVCLLGSATPSMESLHNVNTKKYSLSRLKKESMEGNAFNPLS